jgi:hypothetical protein
MVQKHIFNYCFPREYIKDGETRYALVGGGEKMKIGTLEEAQSLVTESTPKEACPWLQIFSNGYRVCRDNIDWSQWNGFTFSDVDSKWFFDDVKPFDTQKCLEGLFGQSQVFFKDNFYAIYMSNSKKGYRILWYWDCERNEENFRKCAVLTDKYVRELFYSLGDHGRQIIDYKGNGHRVLDHCSKSVFQGFYMTKQPILYGEPSGACDLSEISVSDAYEESNVVPIVGDYKQTAELVSKNKPKKNLDYYSHPKRWGIYEALIVLFKDKDKVDEEWKYVCEYLPEEKGHNKKFYLGEPSRNRWYARFNDKVMHSLNCLKAFGYNIKDSSNYIYYKQFRASWKDYIYNKVILEYLKDAISEINASKKKADAQREIEKLLKKTKEEHTNIFDAIFDDMNSIEDYRVQYYKSVFDIKDWNHLYKGYECPKDAATYSMFADLYYRDENNQPTIKYDILEDDILVHSFWFESRKCQWHTLKYNNEWTEWCNHDKFSNKCNRTDLQHTLYEFVPKYYGFNYVKDYWKNLDLSLADKEKLETWGIRYFGMEDTPYVRWVCKTFFIAAVAKQMVENPIDCVFPHVLFLKGKTGCGKTFFMNQMFTFNGKQLIVNDVNPNWEDRVIGPIIAKNMLLQFSESVGLKKSDVHTQKEFIDRINMGFKFQKKYENEQTTTYFRGVVCRSTNEDTLFNDISISEGDRRNLLLVCNTPEMNATKQWRDDVIAEKDTLWATAYKLYLDDPNQDLQLPTELFYELAEKQEDYKLTQNDDIREVYERLFERNYNINANGEMLDEKSFNMQAERSDELLTGQSLELAADAMGIDSGYSNIGPISKIPISWVKKYVSRVEGLNTYRLLKDYMLKNGWNYKNATYNKVLCKCLIR